MAIGGSIYGYIETPWGAVSKTLRRHNVRVLQHLPREDKWPALIRPMFGITGPTAREGAYDHDLVHYGVTLKGMDDADAINWIAKFEALLSRLYWFEAVMHVNWIFGPRTFRWVADKDQVHDVMWNKSRKTMDRWEFDDGGAPIERWTK
jgi:hypothetical protein